MPLELIHFQKTHSAIFQPEPYQSKVKKFLFKTVTTSLSSLLRGENTLSLVNLLFLILTLFPGQHSLLC